MAIYYEKQGRHITIVAASKMLATQTKQLINELCKESRLIEVTLPKYMTQKINDLDVVICDEGDFLIENKNIIFKETNGDIQIMGVFRSFSAKNLIIMSARFN